MDLSVKYLKRVLNELSDAKSKWYNIGIELELDISELESIKKDKRESTYDCFRETIVAWFKSISQIPKTWSTLAEALKAPLVGFGQLATQIEEKYCQSQPQTGEKRPHPSDESESATKQPRLAEEGCNCEELKKLLQVYSQCIQELKTRLNHLEASTKHQDVHIQALAEDDDDMKKENAKLRHQYSKLEKQVKEHSGQLQQLTTQISQVNESTPTLPLTQTNEIDDNILWMRRVLHDVRDDWYDIGCEFEVGLGFLDDIKSKHSENAKHCLFLVLREWLTQLAARGDKECKMCKLIQVLESPLLGHNNIAQTLDDTWHIGCPSRGPREYGRFYPF